MNTYCATLILFTIMTFIAFSQGQKKYSSIKLNDTEEFFSEFHSLKEPPQRGEFETLEEYKKRLPKPFDTSKVVYLRIKASVLEKSYNYDIESGLLTFMGGKIHTEGFMNAQRSKSIQVEIYSNSETKREYEASNVYGKTVTVREVYVFDYVLNLKNLDLLPDSIYDKEKCNFRLTINRPPKEAESLSKNISLVIGFKPIDPSLSAFNCYNTSKPTIDIPREYAFFHYLIDAKFISLLLYNENSKKVILKYDK